MGVTAYAVELNLPQPVLPIETKYSDFQNTEILKNGEHRKLDFSDGHNFLCEKNWAKPFMQGSFPQPFQCIEPKILDLSGKFLRTCKTPKTWVKNPPTHFFESCRK